MTYEIPLAVAIVALAVWDVFRRRFAAQRVSDREDIEQRIEALVAAQEAETKQLRDQVIALDNRIKQLANRPQRRPLSGLSR